MTRLRGAKAASKPKGPEDKKIHDLKGLKMRKGEKRRKDYFPQYRGG